MFQLSLNEASILRSQFAISSGSYGGRRYLPYVFTEQGVAMLSSVLRSSQSIAVNIAIMRTFVKLRNILASNRELARKLEELEKQYNANFRVVFKAIAQLMNTGEVPKKRQIGFRSG